ncbi:MAG: tyrosine-type recombinase/integrase [Thermoguttaceae bacterium]
MPRKPTQPSIACQFFTWRLFRRDGVYYADARGGRYDLGKHSLGTRDRDEAVERLKLLDRQKAVEVGLAGPALLQPVEAISLADGWKLFLEYCERSPVLGGVSPGTVKRYRAVRDKHLKFCSRHGITTWNEFDKRGLEQYAKWLGRKYADRTVYLEATTLKTVNGWLIDNQKLPAEAKLLYNLQKPQGTDTYCYSRQEVAAMIKHCTDAPGLGWLGHVILALAHTGMRISELAGLRWSDVDLEANAIRVMDERSSKRRKAAGTARTTKGRRSRVIPIHTRLKHLLKTLEHQPDGYVLHARRGGRLHPRNILHDFIQEVIEPLKEKFPTSPGEIGFEHGRIHSFRHFFCSQTFLGGASEGEIREWLGHAESKMVELYRHLRNEDAQRKMEQIDFTGPEDSDTPRAGNS